MRTPGMLITLLLICAVLGGLASIPAANALDPTPQEAPPEDAAKKKSDEKEDPATKIASLERKLRITGMKLEHAEFTAASGQTAAEVKVRQAREELTIAEGALVQYRQFDSRREIEAAKLSLRGSRDRAEEAAEELAQIELMYKDQDLDDRTAEFVVRRGRRNAERAAQRIALEEMALESLSDHAVPRGVREHQLKIDQKRSELEAATRALQSHALKSRIDITSAQSEIEGLQQELSKLRSEG